MVDMGLILVVLGMILMGVRGFGVEGPGRVHLGWLGAAVTVLGALVVPGI